MKHDYHFSLEEAQDLVEELEPKVREVLELRHDLDAKGFDIRTGEYAYGEPDREEKDDIIEKVERVQELLREIHETGALFKDPNFELGMLDFPHVTENGEEVYLCWMQGEEEIKYWHPIETGMRGRK
ncbi:MAG: DUF2203 domain-containing protein, partial [Halobacteria archaeon]|nr:DUF2203 domain-containing protein [Halobacteria archaeon]